MGSSNPLMRAEEGVFQFKACRGIADQRHLSLARQFAKAAWCFRCRRVVAPPCQPGQ
jgi:hypothetical protein